MAQNESVFFSLVAQDKASEVFKNTEKALGGLGNQFLNVKGLIATLGAAVGVQQFASMILSTTEAIGKYKDLGEVAGTTAERISGMAAPAHLAGISLDTVAASVAKLGKSIGEARLGDVGKRSLLQALGIDPDDGRDAAEVYVDVARAVSGMKDQTIAGKVSSDLLGKSYAELRVFMKELTEQGGLVARVTNEQAESADRFQKDLGRLSLKVSEAKQALVTEMLPGLNSVADAMVRGQKEGGALIGIIEGLRTAYTNYKRLDDQSRSDRAIFDLTERQLDLEKRIAQVRNNAPGFRGALRSLEAELASVNEQIKTTLAMRKLLEDPAAATGAPSAGGTGTQAAEDAAAAAAAERRVRERMEFEKHYQERVVAAQGFYTRYADAIKVGQALFNEVQAQGLFGRSEVIEQERAVEDARLQVLINALQQQRSLHQQMGDLAKARVAQDQIAAAQAARIANDAIAAAKQTSSEAALQNELAASQNRRNAELAQMVRNVEQQNMTEMELVRFHLSEKLEALDKAEAAGVLIAGGYARQRYLAEVQAQAALGDATAQGIEQRRRIEQMGMMQQAQFYFGQLAQITAAGAQHNRTLFNLNKLAGISNAIISTSQGVAKALEWGFPMGPIFAAIIGAAGLVQINTIRATQFGQGSSAPSVGGGTAIPVTPALSGPQFAPLQLPGGSQSSQTVFNFNINGPVSHDVIDEIMKRMRDEIGNNDAIIIPRNSRQAAELTS